MLRAAGLNVYIQASHILRRVSLDVGPREVVCLVGRNGATVVLKRSDKLEKLATNQLEDKFDASPAVAGPRAPG